MEATITDKVFHYPVKKSFNQPLNLLEIENDTDTLSKNSIALINMEKRIFKTVPVYYIINTANQISKKIDINGVEFEINVEDGDFIISHPKWSLLGTGKTLYNANIDLYNEAKNILQIYLETPLSDLTVDAIEFREFLLDLF